MTQDQIMIFLLAIDAGIVAVGLSKKKNMWLFILLYWMALLMKNAMNLIVTF